MKISTLIILAVVFAAGLGLLLAMLKKRSRSEAADEPWPFYAKKPLTQPEQILYHRLVKALPEHIVLAQVQVSRVLGVKKGFKFHEWNNRINRLTHDFVVCSKDSTVVAAIELDDKSHDAEDRGETDKRKDKATAAAGIRIVRWNVKAIPDEGRIHASLVQFTGNTA
jgi:very-short-patch-repair endonuclease